MPKVKCKLCSSSIDRDKAYRTALQSFCDVDHYKEYSAKATKKRSKPKVDGGWKKLRLEVIGLDGGRCRACGTKYNLHVHHIVYRSEREDNSYENLITLCQKHHDLVHSDKAYYQPECIRVVATRGVVWQSLTIKRPS